MTTTNTNRTAHPFEDRWSRETCWLMEDMFNLVAARSTTPDSFTQNLMAAGQRAMDRDPAAGQLFGRFVARKMAAAASSGVSGGETE